MVVTKIQKICEVNIPLHTFDVMRFERTVITKSVQSSMHFVPWMKFVHLLIILLWIMKMVQN